MAVLEINLSVATARWEHFGTILDREWSRRDQWPAKHLLQLGFVCAEADRDRAVQLAELAASRGADDPAILGSAYLLVSRLGREDVGRFWMLRAAQLSKEDGPVQTGTLSEAVSMLSASINRTRGNFDCSLGRAYPPACGVFDNEYVDDEISGHRSSS
jgi:hypothetical protein